MKKIIAAIILTVTLVTASSCGILNQKPLTLGEYDENTYTSTFAGIKYELPENASFYDETQRKELAGITSDITGAEIDKLLTDTQTYFDMIAVMDTGSNVNIVIGKLSAINALKFDEESWLKASNEKLPAELSAQGFDNISTDIGDTEFLGKNHKCINLTYMLNGVEIHQCMVVLNVGRYVFTITATDMVSDKPAQLFDAFSEINN